MKSVRKGVANATGVHGFFSGKKEDQTPQEAEESASGRQTASGEPPSPRPISEPTTDEEGGGAAGIANPIASDPQRESDASAVQSESFAEFDRGGSSIMGGLPSTDDDSRAPSAHVEMREMRETMGASSMGRTSAAAEAASDNPLRSSAAPPPTDSGAAEMAQPSTDAPSDGALWKAKAAQLRADAGERFAPLSEVTSKLAAANSAEDFFKRLRELDPRQKRTLGLTALCIFFVLLLLIVIPAAANSGAGDGDAYDPRASHLITADSSVALAGVAPDDAAAIGESTAAWIALASGSDAAPNLQALAGNMSRARGARSVRTRSVDNKKWDDILAQTLEHLLLSRGEKSALRQVLADEKPSPEQLAFCRNRAFAHAKGVIPDGQARQTLDWLEDVVGLLFASLAESASDALPLDSMARNEGWCSRGRGRGPEGLLNECMHIAGPSVEGIREEIRVAGGRVYVRVAVGWGPGGDSPHAG